MKIRERIRNGVNRVGESLELFKKDVFELAGVPAFREYYTLFIFTWQAVYKGFYRAWHEVPVMTIRDPKGKKRTLATMNAGKMACSQMARYVWNERCAISASMANNQAEVDPLNEFLQDVLKDNRFFTAFGDLLEKSFALGGGALKEWVEVPKDDQGNDIGEGKVRIGYTMASQFVPTAWDNSRVTAGIFISREAKDGYYYTTVEWHKLDGTTYRVTNDLYRNPIKSTEEPQNILRFVYCGAVLFCLAVWTYKRVRQTGSKQRSIGDWIAALLCTGMIAATATGLLSVGSEIADLAVITGCALLEVVLTMLCGSDNRKAHHDEKA